MACVFNRSTMDESIHQRRFFRSNLEANISLVHVHLDEFIWKGEMRHTGFSGALQPMN